MAKKAVVYDEEKYKKDVEEKGCAGCPYSKDNKRCDKIVIECPFLAERDVYYKLDKETN